jgi:PAS domain S-box-containing protein
VLTIFSVTAVGLTALQINYRYLENDKRAQSMNMIRKYYQAQEHEITNMVVLAASRPSLASLMQQKDAAALKNYLTGFLNGMTHIDAIFICDTSGKLLASTPNAPQIKNCDYETNPLYTVIYEEGTPQAWLLRGRQIRNQDQTLGTVMLGLQLDNAFLVEMCDTCNLYHTLIHEGQVVATSFGPNYSKKSNLQIMPATLADEQFKESFTIQDHEYYVSYFPLNGNELTVEVALDITTIKQDQRQQELFLSIVILVVILISVLFAIFLAQCIQRPLAQLVRKTNMIENPDLSKPIRVDTKLEEVVELSSVLEESRSRIQAALTSLQAEKQWNDLLLQSIVEGIIILNQDDIIYFSPGAERITGWAEKDALHSSINDILKPTESTNSFLSLLPSLGEKLRQTFILKEEQKKILAITHAKLPATEIDNAATVLVLRDVSEEEALNHLLGSFLGNITHEFRTPLSALTASIEILLDESDHLTQLEMKELLRSIHLSILNLENLIDNLLEGSSIETGRFKVNPQPTDIRNVIKTATTTMEPLLRKYGQTLKINQPKTLPLVLIDARRIVQVIINLLSNASKYGPNDSEIIFSVREQGAFIEISVADQGEGIPIEVRDKIFSGIAVPNHNGVLQKGARLGLMVTQTIIKAHQGEIGVREHAGGGAEFWLTIPITGEV